MYVSRRQHKDNVVKQVSFLLTGSSIELQPLIAILVTNIGSISHSCQKNEDSNKKRQKYCKWTHGQRAEIGADVAQHWNAVTARLLGRKYFDLARKSVSDFKLAYLKLKMTRRMIMLKRL